MNWVNNKAGEFWEEKIEKADMNKILAHRYDYERNIIPTADPVIILITTDVQKDYLVYTVRAHSLRASFLLDYGILSTPSDIMMLKGVRYINPVDREYCASYCLLDSGYRTAEMYEFATMNQGIVPLKGNEGKQRLPVTWQEIKKYPGKEEDLIRPIKLMHVHSDFFKEQLMIHLSKGFDGEGNFNVNDADWFLFRDVKADYGRQLTGEVMIEDEDNKGRIKRYWKKLHDNHYFDCEVYQLAGRYIIQNDLQKLQEKRKPVEYVVEGAPR